ncbi:MAG: YwaF family protein [Clostridia bacterium]|nr:YwaF family protein [Clostridia bacterium]
MNFKRINGIALQVCTGLYLAISLVLTFTVSDYYIFNRIGEFDFFFVISHWFKKCGLLLLPLAVWYKKKCCADIAKYFLPVFIIVGCCTFGSFFDVTLMTESATPAQKVFASINEFMPKAANMTLFFFAAASELICCALLFVQDGYKVSAKSFVYLPLAIVAVMPLNIFENFFDINSSNIEEWKNSFLWFKNFTLWHFLALAILVGFTVGCYYILKRFDKKKQNEFLIAGAIVLLIQYHSKDSMLLGDGYNVYNTVFAAIPLFICNMGVYVSSLSVILKKRVLYAISFFVHAAGALTVFIYFGKDEMSNYGIFCSYSILYFCLTHCLLFGLCVLPSALGHYKFRIKDCIIPIVYYCFVIIFATVTSGLVSTFLTTYSYDGYTIVIGDYGTADMSPPNYAFTQVNPLPLPFNYVPFTIGNCTFYLSYLIALYAVYVGLFWIFTGGYYAFLAVRRRIFGGQSQKTEIPIVPIALSEAAVADDSANITEKTEDNDEEKVV